MNVRLGFSCGVEVAFSVRVDGDIGGETGGEAGGEGPLDTLDSAGPTIRRVG